MAHAWLSTGGIRSNGAEWHVLNGLALHHRAWLTARRRAMLRWSIVEASTIVTFAAGHAMALGLGGYLWLNGEITLGTVYLFFYYVELLRRPIEQLRRELEEMQRAFASVGRVDELLHATSRLPEGRGVPLPAGAIGVELEAVSFAYEPDATAARADAADLVLRDVSVALAPGRTLGVLGRTGSGKTTLARLLMRFYDPTSGAVRLGQVCCIKM